MSNRGQRTPRWVMLLRMFALIWSGIYSCILFVGLFGMVVGFGAAFAGVLIGAGGFILLGWLVVNGLTALFNWNNPDYRMFRRSGGDPYWDLTVFWPFNTDSVQIRQTGLTGNELRLTCPNCDLEVPNYGLCPHCGVNTMEYVGCNRCGNCTHDPNNLVLTTGIHCAHCGEWLYGGPDVETGT